MAGGAFDKDFGYLMPFLEKVAESANSFPDAAAREELKRLVAGEQARWRRIRELLSGGAPNPAPATDRPAVPARAAAAINPSAEESERAPVRRFTVGSLRPR